MHFNSIFPLRGVYTTEALNREIQSFFRKDGRLFCLKETGDELFWQDQLLVPQLRYVWQDPDALMEKTKTEPDTGSRRPRERKEFKDVWVAYPYFFRSADTGSKWVAMHRGCYIPPAKSGWLDTLFLQEDYAVLERYIVTDDPQAEEPCTEFQYYEAPDGTVMITDVKHYCERLKIPARINNKRVVSAGIPYSFKVRHVRELVVEEGVERLDFCWSLSKLAVISLPAQTVLMAPPDRITSTEWFRSQPDGPVYLNGWYCGYKGDIPENGTLRVQEGTVGIIPDCDESVQWQRVILPDSVCYLGRFAFAVPRRDVAVECSSDVLAAAFDPFFCPEPDEQQHKRTASFPTGVFRNGKQLYDLCMWCPELEVFRKEGAVPLPPRLTYANNRWGAEFLLVREDAPGAIYKQTVYCAAFDLATGALLNPPSAEKAGRYFFRSYYGTEAYLTPYYLRGAEYLDYCAALIRSGAAPGQEELDSLYDWWQQIIPGYTRQSLQIE